MSNKRDIAKLLLDSKVVLFNPENPFRFVSGILSPIYCDNRLLVSNVDGRRIITESFVDLISTKVSDLDVVAGVATSAIAFASWVSWNLSKPMIYVRKREKGHGRGKQIEGHLSKDSKVVVIEDLVTTGGSLLSVVDSIREEGGVVKYCFSIMSYQMESLYDKLKKKEVYLKSLCDFDTLIEVGLEDGYINEKDRGLLLEWKKDPKEWEAKRSKI